MQIYTVREAARKIKLGNDTLRRALEEGLIKGSRLSNGQWRIAESALDEAMHEGIDLSALPKRSKSKKKQPQPEALRQYQEGKRTEKN